MKQHIERAHGRKPFSCAHCSQEFTNFSKLQKHVRADHEGKKVPKQPYETREASGSGGGDGGKKEEEEPGGKANRREKSPADKAKPKLEEKGKPKSASPSPKSAWRKDQSPGQPAVSLSKSEAADVPHKVILGPVASEPMAIFTAPPAEPLDYLGRNASYTASFYPMKRTMPKFVPAKEEDDRMARVIKEAKEEAEEANREATKKAEEASKGTNSRSPSPGQPQAGEGTSDTFLDKVKQFFGLK